MSVFYYKTYKCHFKNMNRDKIMAQNTNRQINGCTHRRTHTHVYVYLVSTGHQLTEHVGKLFGIKCM